VSPYAQFGADGNTSFQVLWADGERVFRREMSPRDGSRSSVLTVLPAPEHPTPAALDRLAHEYGLKDELDSPWAARPLELIRERGRTMLVLEDPGGEPLERLIGAPLELGHFLRLAIDITIAVGMLHRRGLLHKDLKPSNILVNCPDGRVRLTGFGIASRVPRERQAPGPPETIAGTLAYMAPEQTGRMNRSIDSRSDLYALGVTFYQMLTGSLPFAAADPMEWVHCHIVRKPLPPGERLENIPRPVSEIIMKLLAKTAEERYQTAAGVENDLRRCLAEQERKGRIDSFAIGEHDVSDRLLLPEKLYGRAREIETLLACFDRIVNTGAAELVLVSGYSGIGKSSVVNELQKSLVQPRALFASGKFDQYKRDIPYSTLAQAFQSLIRPLLGKSDPELAGWREAFREALGPNGRLIIDLVPELKLIVGDQPSVPELPPHDAQRRFQLAFRRFLAVFARPEHPLALFLDDLQWLDSATLDLLEDLLTQPDVHHLMLIGAYRDNEVNSAHPLIRKLEAIRKAGAVVHEIILAPLAPEDLGRLIGDALHCEPERVTALAELIQEKTAGNPFFAIQLISVLVEEGLLTFDYGERRWSWDLNGIHAKGYTDNVVDLMVGKLKRLPAETQHALQLLACIGNSAEYALLEKVSRQSSGQMYRQLREAIRAGLIFRTQQSYTFLHDRVQEAAYSLIPKEARAEAHLQIGRLLVTCIASEDREETIFEIVNQLNRGTSLMTSQEEREKLAELNLIAGKRAKASSAYASALNYLAAGTTLLEEVCWERCYELIFALELHRAQCEFLTGELTAAEQRLAALSLRAGNTPDRATVASLRVDLHLTAGQASHAVEVGLEYLGGLGIDWSAHPTDEEARAEYERMWSQLGDRAIEDLIEMPFLTDSIYVATLEVLTRLFPAVVLFDANLTALVACRAVSLSLEHGNCDASCAHYAWLGRVLGGRFGDYQAAYRFGRLACDLVDRRGLTRFQAQVYMAVASNVIPWVEHVRDGRNLLRRAFDAARRAGNLIHEAYSLVQLNANMLIAGDPLAETQREVEASLDNVRKMKFRYAADVITTQLGYIRTLRGHTQQHEQDVDERTLSGNPDQPALECAYWIRVLQARFIAGHYAAASYARSMAERHLWTLSTELASAEFHFYGALSLAACRCPSSAASETEHLDAIYAHHAQLRAWERNCRSNFEHRAALVGAEIARVEGREAEAMRLYEQAILAAEANGFVHHKAIACELAGYFYSARGFEKIAQMYLQDARHCYVHWGADAKVRRLEQRYPHLADEDSAAGPTSTIGASVEQLDLATVIKVSQAVSGEIVLDNLIDTLMRTAVVQAGAARALLIMRCGHESRIGAEATTSGDTVTVRLVDEAVTERMLPESVLHFVLRTREIVVLDDAAARSPFGDDPYIRLRQARSILSLPLLNQAKLIGVLYLENNLTPRVFAPTRISVLKLLASQAAIALENAHLYRDVAEREKQLTATSEVLRTIANAPSDLQSALDAVAEHAARLCDASNARIWRLEDNFLRLVASYGESSATMDGREGLPADRDTVTGRAACDRRTIHVHDIAAEADEYPVGSRIVKGEGWHTTLATPLLREGTPIGIILVRRMEVRPFHDQQIALLEIFADQAAIAIENVRLFESERQRTLALAHANRDLAEREMRIRRLVDSNIIGIFIWDFEGRILEANDEFLRMVGYGREDLLLGRIRWTDLTPPNWNHRSKMRIEIQRGNGRFDPFEKEYFRKDGSRVPVLIGGATFEEGEDQGVAFVLDLTDRKRVEAEAIESEGRYREVQTELAHAHRMATMGQLTASIAHEVKQPIATARNNARAALNFLDRNPPDLGEVREALGCVVGDADRAGDIIDRIRDHIKKAPPRKDRFDLNQAIDEVIVLARSAITKNEVSVQTRLTDGLFLVRGDRVQLQQVVLNLILNAVEAMSSVDERARELLISTAPTETNYVLVTVSDCGPGIDPDCLERVFEAFYTTKRSGVGLGLSICRSIIEAHAGRLWTEANAPSGARFKFTIPSAEGNS
jgi:PAS domain S-box-containing protein